MTERAKDRVLAALAFEETSFVPYAFGFAPDVGERLHQHYGMEDPFAESGMHVFAVGPRAERGFVAEAPSADEMIDEFGVDWHRSPYGALYPDSHPLLDSPLSAYRWPDANAAGRFEHIYATIQGHADRRSPTQLSVMRADQSLDLVGDGYWPCDSAERFYNYSPDDPDFYFCASFNVRHPADFLTGATVWLRESPHNDVHRASRQGAAQVCGGLADGFFGDLLTHEQKLQVLTLDEWDQVVAGVERKATCHEKLPSNHDEIANYIKAKDETWIARSECRGHCHSRTPGASVGDGLSCVLKGRAEHALRLSLSAEVEGGVERRHADVLAFANEMSLEIFP